MNKVQVKGYVFRFEGCVSVHVNEVVTVTGDESLFSDCVGDGGGGPIPFLSVWAAEEKSKGIKFIIRYVSLEGLC